MNSDRHLEPAEDSSRSRGRLLTMAGLALGGFLASLATLYATPIEGVTDLGCGPRVVDCGKALGSAWSKVAGVPLGVIGGFYFALWGLFTVCRPAGYRWAVSWILLPGAIGSLGLLAVLAGVVQAPCLWCLLTHACNLAACVVWWPLRRWRPAGLWAGGAVAVGMAALLAAAGLFGLYRLRVEKETAAAAERTLW